MPSILGYRTQALLAFVASLYVGLRAARDEDGAKNIKMNVVMNLLSTLGLLIGYRLASRRRGSGE